MTLAIPEPKTRFHERQNGPALDCPKWQSDTTGLLEAVVEGNVWVQYPGTGAVFMRQLAQAEERNLLGVQRWQPAFLTDILSYQEFRVFMALARGYYPSQVARTCYLSIKTVSTYKSRIIEKTGLTTSVHMAVYAYRLGLTKWPLAPVEYVKKGARRLDM